MAKNLHGGGIKNLLNKDVKELNGIILSLFCISILVISGVVSYKVTNSYALFSDNVKGEKTIELGIAKTSADILINGVGISGFEEIVHEADETLQIGATKKLTEYRFRGGDDVVTNNYVYFNCNDTINQNDTSCELYRIIGVFPVDDGNGNIENRIKLIKAESYGEYGWDSAGDSNNWNTSNVVAQLNENYLNSIETNYQGFFGDAKYYLGSDVSADEVSLTSDLMYQYERKISGSAYYATGNPNSWVGKIGLMYASDYGYGSSSICSSSLYSYDNSSCYGNDWLYLGTNEWLINHSGIFDPDSPAPSYYVLRVASSGRIETFSSGLSNAIRPVFYLNADVMFADGDGSREDPYKFFEETPKPKFTLIDNDDLAFGFATAKIILDDYDENSNYSYILVEGARDIPSYDDEGWISFNASEIVIDVGYCSTNFSDKSDVYVYVKKNNRISDSDIIKSKYTGGASEVC